MLRILVVEEERPDGAFALLGEGRGALPIEALERCLLPQFPHQRMEAGQYHLVLLAPREEVEEGLITALADLRRRNGRLFVALVLPPDCDLSRFIRPSIQPSGVLFLPLVRGRLYALIREIEAERARTEGPGEVFAVKTGGEVFYVETQRISFFEARSKKIALKTDVQEILFYSSFDKLQSQLPGQFVRCHKGFLVNTALIQAVRWPEMELTMRDGSVLPISRTGRQVLQQALARQEGGRHGARQTLS